MKFPFICLFITQTLAGSFLIEQNGPHYKVVNIDPAQKIILTMEGSKIIRDGEKMNREGQSLVEYACMHPKTIFTGDAKEVFCADYLIDPIVSTGRQQLTEENSSDPKKYIEY